MFPAPPWSSRLLLRTRCTGGLGLKGEPQLLRTSLGGASCSLTWFKSPRSWVRVRVFGAGWPLGPWPRAPLLPVGSRRVSGAGPSGGVRRSRGGKALRRPRPCVSRVRRDGPPVSLAGRGGSARASLCFFVRSLDQLNSFRGGVPRFRRSSEGLRALRLVAERGASAVVGGGPCAHFEGQRRRAFGRSAASRPLCCPPLFSGGLSSFSRLFVGGGVLAFLFVLRWPLRPRAPAMAAPRAPVPVSRARAS